MYTAYNGKCQLYEFYDPIAPKSYLQFYVPKNQSFFAMILPRQMELFMLTQQWLDGGIGASIPIDAKDMIVYINRYTASKKSFFPLTISKL